MPLDPDAVPLGRLKFLKSLHVSRRFGTVYVNNPKVACSTIKLTLQQAELGDDSYEPAKSVHEHRGSPLLTWPELEHEPAVEILQSSFVFSFVRNPFERLRSAYANKIVMPQKKGAHRIRAGFAADECPDFDVFVRAISAIDPLRHDPHWRPQVLNLSIGHLHYDFIGRLENLATDWAWLTDRLGLPVALSEAGKRTPKQRKAALTYTPETAALVARTYADDFELLGYAPDVTD